MIPSGMGMQRPRENRAFLNSGLVGLSFSCLVALEQHFPKWATLLPLRGGAWSVQDVFGCGCILFGFHHLNLRAYDLDLSKVLFIFTCLI